jgi:cyclopropane fatty-acyl-phospholipid synthase-like methyltransferase
MRATDTTSQEFFDQKYRFADDPWNFATDSYEQQRYRAILRALGDRRFERAFEPGCSIGVLTEHLAARCGALVAMDISPTAAERARQRCEHLENVEIVCGSLPEDLPSATFDLIVFSEIGYYFDAANLAKLVEALTDRLDESGTLLSCHWLGVSKDHILSGDEVHEVLESAEALRHESGERRTDFRLDRWVKR